MRGRPPAALLAGIAAAALVAGCGGEQVPADEVPIAPPALTLPKASGEDPLAEDAAETTAETTTTETTTDEQTADPAATPSPPAAPATGGGTGGTTGGGAAPAPAPGGGTSAPAPETPSEDTGGAQFEEFCEQNQGAC